MNLYQTLGTLRALDQTIKHSEREIREYRDLLDRAEIHKLEMERAHCWVTQCLDKAAEKQELIARHRAHIWLTVPYKSDLAAQKVIDAVTALAEQLESAAGELVLIVRREVNNSVPLIWLRLGRLSAEFTINWTDTHMIELPLARSTHALIAWRQRTSSFQPSEITEAPKLVTEDFMLLRSNCPQLVSDEPSAPLKREYLIGINTINSWAAHHHCEPAISELRTLLKGALTAAVSKTTTAVL